MTRLVVIDVRRCGGNRAVQFPRSREVVHSEPVTHFQLQWSVRHFVYLRSPLLQKVNATVPLTPTRAMTPVLAPVVLRYVSPSLRRPAPLIFAVRSLRCRLRGKTLLLTLEVLTFSLVSLFVVSCV